MYRVVRNVLVFLLRVFYRWRFIGLEKIPRSGPVIIAPNHISNFDPLCVAFLVDQAGRRPRMLAKASLWSSPMLPIVTFTRQIPVRRGTGETTPMEAAEEAIAKGECIVIYPEGTITTNVDLTPMQGKTGIARLALSTGAPVYPIAVWGAQWMAGKGRVMRYFGHRQIVMIVGEEMRFDDLLGQQEDPDVRREVTDRIVAEIDKLVRELHKIHPDGGAVPPVKGES